MKIGEAWGVFRRFRDDVAGFVKQSEDADRDVDAWEGAAHMFSRFVGAAKRGDAWRSMLVLHCGREPQYLIGIQRTTA